MARTAEVVDLEAYRMERLTRTRIPPAPQDIGAMMFPVGWVPVWVVPFPVTLLPSPDPQRKGS